MFTKALPLFAAGCMILNAQSMPNLFPMNLEGFLATYNTQNSSIDLSGPFGSQWAELLHVPQARGRLGSFGR